MLGHANLSSYIKVIDKVGRTGRRTVAHHVRNALARPRLATSIRRMTAVFELLSDLRKWAQYHVAPTC